MPKTVLQRDRLSAEKNVEKGDCMRDILIKEQRKSRQEKREKKLSKTTKKNSGKRDDVKIERGFQDVVI